PRGAGAGRLAALSLRRRDVGTAGGRHPGRPGDRRPAGHRGAGLHRRQPPVV
ncbi:MAG: hypothetical protein AVDCRST_MAG48-2883, partial [uncultured Friedmanniella sp.]